jgi:hypothetical protein
VKSDRFEYLFDYKIGHFWVGLKTEIVYVGQEWQEREGCVLEKERA